MDRRDFMIVVGCAAASAAAALVPASAAIKLTEHGRWEHPFIVVGVNADGVSTYELVAADAYSTTRWRSISLVFQQGFGAWDLSDERTRFMLTILADRPSPIALEPQFHPDPRALAALERWNADLTQPPKDPPP